MAEPVSPLREPELNLHEPGEIAQPDPRPEAGAGLCLSGGGYRAMLFHVGSLWRLNELAILPKFGRISSVSGGSITAGLLGLRWKDLEFDGNGVAKNFEKGVVNPLREMARHTIDVGSVLWGLLNPFSTIADNVHAAYRKRLFGEATLQDLPDPPAPRFVLNATNVQSGALWRFSKPFMGDYRVGLTRNPNTSLALAVTASSAFPPFLSPVRLKTANLRFEPDGKSDLQREPFTSHVVLSDGGVYDNLGLEAVFKRYDTVLVSDGGAKILPEETPASDWARHSYRILNVVDNQVRSLRKRALIAAYRDTSGNPLTARKGAFWGIGTNILDFQLDTALNTESPFDRTLALAAIPTRLAEMDDQLQERLINWGYSVCDAAIRKHWPPVTLAGGKLPQPKFPYSRGI